MPSWTSFLAQVVGSWLESGVGGTVDQVLEHFSTHGDVVERALAESHQQAWLTVETVLAGPSVMQSVRGALQSGDQKRLTETVREFTEAHFQNKPDAWRGRCLESLRQAKQQGTLALPSKLGMLWPEVRNEVARSPASDASQATVPLGAEHADLIALVTAVQPSGRGLLMELCRAFFLLKVQQDEKLMRTLEYVQWEQVPTRFANLNDALQSAGSLIQQKLDDQQDVLADLRADVKELLVHARLPQGELEPRHSISIHTESEKRLVKDLLRKFRDLPEDRQHQVVDLERDLGELLFGSGLPNEAAEIFHNAAVHEDRPSHQALAHYNAYRSALEQQDWEGALTDLMEAAQRDASRFAPFPLERYTPQRILGAGGFGVVFLCEDHYRGGKDTVIKSLRAADLTRQPEEVFHELAILGDLRHPDILVPFECGYADGLDRQRPYLKMDYFPGQTLQGYVDERGVISATQWRKMALPIAQAMQAAHGADVLHRDLKPDNLLIHRNGHGFEFKIIDFGLALPVPQLQQSLQHGGTASLIGSTAVGTLKYAPPEQRGERPDIRPGPYSDIYSFGKLSCFALFGTTEPRRRHWRDLDDEELADLLEDCLEEEADDRPQSFDEITERLQTTAEPVPSPPTRKTTQPNQSPPAPPTLIRSTTPPRERQAGEICNNNGLKMNLVWCPPGSFTMGSPKTEKGRNDDEDQVHVTLTRGFWLGQTVVTQGQWKTVMHTAPWKGKYCVKEGSGHPATYVSWKDAIAFCQKLTTQERQAGRLPWDGEYTLPTEAQWEHACRGGTTTAYSFGDDDSKLGGYAWFDKNTWEANEKYAHAVGTKKPNPWGLSDIHGNVWEWCRDGYADRLPGGRDPEVTAKDSLRVRRGGCWYPTTRYCRSAYRFWGTSTGRNDCLGFRVAQVLPGK